MTVMNRQLAAGHRDRVSGAGARGERDQLAPGEGDLAAGRGHQRAGPGARPGAVARAGPAARRDAVGEASDMLAERMGRVSASPTMKVLVEADKLRQQGIDVVEFGAGEPDFPTPAHRQGGGARGHRRQLHEVHAGGRHQRAEAGHLRALRGRLRRHLQAQRGHRHRGRQAGPVQRRARALRRRRRGDHPRAVLADAARTGQAGRRHAGRRRDARRRRALRSRPTRCWPP